MFLDNLPALRTRYIIYGARATPVNDYNQSRVQNGDVKAIKLVDVDSAGALSKALDALATLRVPHGYFLHFYIVSVISSGFWAEQLLTKGFAFRTISQYMSPMIPAASMSVDQMALTWALMTVQGVRRLLETMVFARGSTSKMWFAHWLLGLTFYLAFGVALWIEAAPTVLSSPSVFSSITMSAPSLKTLLGIPIFILASGIQHDCHAYLASLPKYTLPIHPIFQVLVCPHYLAECLIYLSLAIIGAPRGAVYNKTILIAFCFVSTNLAVTASASKEWYERRFGQGTVAGRWKMVPWLF